VSWVLGEIISEQGAPSHIQKAHPPQQIIGNLSERVTWSSRLAHLSCFTNTLFVALFEPRDVSYPVFMPRLGTHHMHDLGSIVPHIRPKVFTDNQMP
jgi:hypothetical protein